MGRGFGKNAGEWTGGVEINKEEIPGSTNSMHGNILTTLGFKGRTFNFKLCVLIRWDFNFCIRSSPLWGGGGVLEGVAHLSQVNAERQFYKQQVEDSKECVQSNGLVELHYSFDFMHRLSEKCGTTRTHVFLDRLKVCHLWHLL